MFPSTTKLAGGKLLRPSMYVLEDNEAAIKIVLKKRSMALRHVLRTHRVALDWLFDLFDSPDITLKYIGTKWQAADIFTKCFTKAETCRV